MFNIYILIYVVVALFIIFYGSYKLHGNNQSQSAIIFFIGSLILFIIFGIKWFGDKGSLSKTPVSWPPTINTCPDYLLYYKRKTKNGFEDTCIDTIGVSKKGTLEIFPKETIPSDDKYYFSLITRSSDPAARNTELCKRTITYGLTWEGITNGESCITSDGPVTPSDAGGSDNCPTQTNLIPVCD